MGISSVLLFPLKNRWCRLVSYLWANAVGTLIYFGWAPLSAILFKSGAYAWQCDDTWWTENDQPCVQQYNSVQLLYTIALIGMSVSSVLAGVAYDKLGPLFTSLVSQFLFAGSWVMIAFSSQSAQLYIPAFGLMAASVSFTSFTSLVLCDFFPSRPGLIVALIFTSQGFSTIIPIVFEEVWNHKPQLEFSKIIFAYVLMVLLPTSLVFILSMPLRKPPRRIVEIFEDPELPGPTGGRAKKLEDKSVCKQQGGYGSDDDGIELQQDEGTVDEIFDDVFSLPVDIKGQQASSMWLDDVPISPMKARQIDAASNFRKACDDFSFSKNSGRQSFQRPHKQSHTESSFALMGGVGRCVESLGPFKSGSRQLLREVCTPEYILFTIFYCVELLATAYYPTTVQAQFGTGVSHFMGIMTPFHVIPSLIFGLLVDYTGTIPISIALSLSIAVYLTFAFLGYAQLQKAAVVLHVFSISFAYTVKYTYVQEIFAATNYGTLVGCMATTSGLVLISNILIQRFVEIRAAYLGFLVAIGLTLPILTFLLVRMIKGCNYTHFHNEQQTTTIESKSMSVFSIQTVDGQ